MAGDQNEAPRATLFTAQGQGYFVLGDYEDLAADVEVGGVEGWLSIETISIDGHRFRAQIRRADISLVNELTSERWLWTLNDALEQRARMGVQEQALETMRGMRDDLARMMDLDPGDDEGEQ